MVGHVNICRITIQRNTGGQWPVIFEQQAAGDFLALYREGEFRLDLLDLSTKITPREYGTMLGQALFQGEVRDAFLLARAQSTDYLSVQLFVEAPDLRILRWERLCAPLDDSWNFLLLDQRAPLTLALPSKADRRFPPIKREQLRALVIVACPEGVEGYRLSLFDVKTTVDAIRKALDGIPCDVLSTTDDAVGPPTLDALCEQLTTKPHTLLHFVCHGRYLSVSGETVLYLADERQQVDAVEGARLLDRLARLGNQSGLPYCTFLASCQSASAAAEGALGGLAQRLVRDLGLPAVVAMTEDVSLATSEALTHQFYRRLQKHGYLDVTLAEAYAGVAERPDSTVAVLYSRLGTRPLFEQEEGPSVVAQKRTPEQKKRHAMLKHVRDTWITGLLEHSLYQVARIEIGLEVHPDLLENRWRLAVQELHQVEQILPAGTRILDVYDQAEGELLILGEPGAGKTTLLLELARDLLVRAEHDESHSMPVIFSLSSWVPTWESLDLWLVEELDAKYQIPRNLGKVWIESDQILPLLDGLDEVDPNFRAPCVDKINKYHSSHSFVPIIVCSRSAEYQDLAQTTPILLRKAVVAQPLSEQQVEAYIASAGERLASVQRVLRADPALRKVATTPLMLSVMMLAYHEEPDKEPPGGDSSEARPEDDPSEVRRRVFEHYVERMLQRRGTKSNYEPEQTKRWLSWLARQLIQHDQIFYIERMQPDWLPENHYPQRYSRLAAGLIFGLLGALVVGPFSGSLFFQSSGIQPSFGLVPSFILLFVCVSGLLFGLLNGSLYVREARSTVHGWKSLLRLIGRRFFRAVFNGLLVGLLIGFPSGLVLGHLPDAGTDELTSGIVQGTLFWLFGGAGFALIDGLLGIQLTKIQLAETFDWLWAEMKWNLVKYLFFGLLASFLFALLVGLISLLYILMVTRSANLLSALSDAWLATQYALLATPFLTLISGLLGGLTGGLSGKELDQHKLTIPNEGIQRSARHGLSVGVAIGLIGFLVGGICGGFFAVARSPQAILPTSLTYGLIFGILAGLISGLRSGGIACFEHLALRWLLWKSESTPWNYPRFLNYAAERILLNKVGGGYIFVHRLLLDYFAALKTPSESESTAKSEPT